jgi:hypothetical protein
MLTQADKDFLTLQREQKARAQAQAQAQLDISDISSQSEIEEDEEEVEEVEEVEASSAHIDIKIQEEISPIVVVPQKKQNEALELLKSAFEQIKLALLLLNEEKNDSQPILKEIEALSQTIAPVAVETVAPVAVETFASKAKKPVAKVAVETVAPVAVETVAPVAVETVAPVAVETVAPVAVETVAPVAVETFASKAKKPVAKVAVETSALKAKKPVAPVAEMSSPTNVKENDFQVVMSKKSKSKSTTIIVAPDTANDFPSLGNSFSPVQKTGFWSSGKSSLEIAKSVAQIPSPPPTRSPTLVKPIKARPGSRGPIDEDDDYSDNEFKYRKNGNDEDDEDDYWQ